MIRIVQIACIVTLALVLYGVKAAVFDASDFFGPGFGWGLGAGIFLAMAVYGLICWIDPSSRPRGSSSDK